jgi:hypothetical protein
MSIRFSRTVTALSAIGIAALLLSGCASGSEPTPTATVGGDTPTTSPTAQPAPSATTTASAAATCDSIIVADVHDELGAQGWTFKETPFAAGGVTLDRGLQCTWADYSVASGNLMLFGWGPITADQAATMQQGLEAEGWLREESGDDVFITEDPMQAPTIDDNGYGMTYEFGDGWVMVADTKQNLLLMERPQS